MVEVKDMGFGYTAGRLFSHLDLSLKPGNIYGLLGKNGAGKTSLLKLLCGLRFPQEGTIRVFDFDPAKRPVGMLEDTFFIEEELPVPPVSPKTYESLYAPFYPRFSHEDFESYLREFELEKGKKLTALSFGQKKKFILAFGLACGCRMLLLDEPTNGLDIPSKGQFRKLLTQASRDDRIILISTHQVRDMENLIDPIIILDQGRIIFNQPLSEVTRRLVLRLEPSEPAGSGVLWSDRTVGGWAAVRERTGEEETRIDLETLFNTVIANRDSIAALFAPTAAQGPEGAGGGETEYAHE